MEPRPTPPVAFGKYLLLEKIASGGMAEIYRAVLRGAAGFEKPVALKRILPFFGEDPDFVTLFQDEARIASTLAHGNIAQVFDFGEVDGSYYLALELVEGLDLARLGDRLRDAGQPMPQATAAFVIAEAARGLAHAHEKRAPDGRLLGIVHRDVSPQNILVSYAGEVKVTDFGIAKAAGKAHKTATGVLMGKLRYMSPEQVDGDELDPRSDVFSLGVILYELLTGGPVFPGEQTLRLAELIHTAEIPPPSARNPAIPSSLDGIVLRALARARDARHPRAAELARDLTVWVNQHAPAFTREDLAALVARLAPPPEPASRAAAEAFLSTQVTPAAARPGAIARPISAPTAPGRAAPREEAVPEPVVDPIPATAPARREAPRQLDLPTRTRLPDDDEDVWSASGPRRPRRETGSRRRGLSRRPGSGSCWGA